MRSYHNKVVWITGASSGIGEAMAHEFANQGAILVLAARNVQKLNQIKDSLPNAEVHTVISLDLTDLSNVDALVSSVIDQVGRVDVLVNNGGISQRSLVGETTLEVDRKIMEVNFFGQVYLTKQVWPLLCNSAHANIVLISSVVGTFGFPQRSAYSASKHALEGFFESWMLENTRNNIHFTTVSPGRIQTNISSAALKGDGSSHNKMDDGQLNGIPAEVCAAKIIAGIQKNKRKVYIVQKEMILIVLRKLWPSLFIKLVKKLKLA